MLHGRFTGCKIGSWLLRGWFLCYNLVTGVLQVEARQLEPGKQDSPVLAFWLDCLALLVLPEARWETSPRQL